MDAADLLRLEAAVLRAEQAGGPRCVLVIAGRCNDYPGAAWRCGVLFAAIAFFAAAVFAPTLGIGAQAGVLAAGLGAGLALARWPWLRRLFVSERQCTDHALRHARDAHLAPGLAGDGVLLLLARFERRVVARANPASGLTGAGLRALADQVATRIGDVAVVDALNEGIAGTTAAAAARPATAAAGTTLELRPRVVVEG